MIDFTKPVQTRDGRKVRVLCTDGPGPHGVVGYIGDYEYPTFWDKCGVHINSYTSLTRADLINVPEKLVAYVNFFPGRTSLHYSREQADKYTAVDRIARVRVEAVEGQFDD